MSPRGQGCGGSGDMQGHTGAATREGRGQEDGDATREYRKGDREAGQARTCIRVIHCFSYVYLVRCPCLWDIVSCRVNRMHDARLLALRHC